MQFNVKAVMFDLDGTLLDTAPQIAEAANRMLVALGKPMLPQAQITTYIGEGVPTLIKRSLTGKMHTEPDAFLFAQAQPLYAEFYANVATESRPFAGVVQGLQQLQQRGFELACVTNKPARYTLPLLTESGLADYFSLVVSGDTLSKKKPDPIQLHHICAEFGVLEPEAMLVGDSATDIAAARAAGCFIVTVPYGYNQGRPIQESLIDASIQNIADLTYILV